MQAFEYWDDVASHCLSENDSGGIVLSDNFPKRRAILRKLLAYDFTGREILEIGTGMGYTPALLSACYGWKLKYTGTDISAQFTEIASKFGLDVKHASPKALPFEDKSFDVVFLFDVLEHIPYEERAEVYKEISRVLKDRALVFINNPNPKNPNLHNPDFEFGFNELDLGALSTAVGVMIHEVSTITAEDRLYQFMVLKR